VTKRLIDIVLSLGLLVVSSPLILLGMLAVVVHDGGSPIYWAPRVGRGGRDFRMAKLRTMTPDADRRGGSSTSRSDARITAPGRVLRRWKLDELPQLWNVLCGRMSLVGPRPNLRPGGVDLYTHEEQRLLDVRPGVTDLASIVFSDEADILDGAADPDAAYDRLIRPWKSRLGLLYVERRSVRADLEIIALTVLAIAAKPAALRGVGRILDRWSAPEDLRRVCRRLEAPPAAEPPGVTILFYRWDGPAKRRAVPPTDCELRTWRPAGDGYPPIGSFFLENLVWLAFDRLGIFASREFEELTLWRGGRLAHRLVITPRWPRFPFMAEGDLQIGALWTAPKHRRLGYAAAMVGEALGRRSGRPVWYLVEAENAASIRLAQACGFRLAGRGRRTRPLGMTAFGRFRLEAGAAISGA
jgi:lipopolysaccharide/colanic/teichoic acid biosynthesis glycosyltransferase/RimJ/RimL family protein N-acetyltransferase